MNKDKKCIHFSKKAYINRITALLFKGSLTDEQKKCISIFSMIYIVKQNILGEPVPVPYLAYVLATTYHETAITMKPIEEYGKGSGRPYGEPDPTTGQTYFGRGYVQLTWDYNYQKACEVVRDMQTFDIGVIDFMDHPEFALLPINAAQIALSGMVNGWFTGKRMSDYLNGQSPDYINARRIINGTDKAELIAGYAESFEQSILFAAGKIKIDRALVKSGSTGDDVREIQLVLNLSADGIAGALTAAAITDYQEAHDLTADGMAGSATWESIDSNVYQIDKHH